MTERTTDLERVAANLRSVLGAFAANIVTNVVLLIALYTDVAPSSLQIIRLVGLAAAILTAFFLVRLMVAMGYSTGIRILAVVALFIPLVGLIVMARITGRAANELRAAGYEIGLLGVKPDGRAR